MSLQILAQDQAVNVLMPFFVFQDTPLDADIVGAVAGLRNLGKPIICCAAGGPYTQKMVKAIEAYRIPVYETGERAVAAVRALVLQARVAGKVQ